MMFAEFMPLARASFISIGLVVGGVSSTMAAPETQTSENAVSVAIDRAKVVRIAKSADTIIVGNPSIVDATIQDARTIVLTGRNFGVTNLIVLDAEGDVVVDETIVVKGSETNLVRVYRQSYRQTLACSPTCESTLSVGDNPVEFKWLANQVEKRTELADKNSRTGSR